MDSAIPFLGHADADAIVAWRAGRPVPAARFFGDVGQLTKVLPAAGHVVNVCADRYCFSIALAAALSRGQVTLLPSDLTPNSLRQLRAAYSDLYILGDSQLAFEGIDYLRFQPRQETRCEAAHSPAFAPEQPAIIAFTSGSTGKPMPNRKTWGALARGAAGEARALGLLGGSPAALLGTVPPQHMYGLESTVLLALRNGLAFHAARPFYPADIRAALEELPAERVLVTTPVHLRAMLEADMDLPELRLAVCATAPLSADLATRFETRYGVELREIYGFTEAGMVATRRTVQGPLWRTLPGVRLLQERNEVRVAGGHVETEVAFCDVIELNDEHSFVLIGRGRDVVNIAGKRTSLAFLDRQLNSIPGVVDGTFFIPEERVDRVVRPLAFAVAPGLTRQTLLEQLRGRIDEVFLPRPLYFVDSLPRNATGKLPRQVLIELAAGCARGLPPGVQVEIDTCIAPDHPALAGHFPGNPVIPGAVLLDELVEAVSGQLGWARGPLTVVAAKFLRPVRPGERLHLRLTPAGSEVIRFDCQVDGQSAISGRLERGDGA